MTDSTPDPKQLPHILQLLDDPSEVVQAAIADVFESWGSDLEPTLEKLDTPPDATQRELIDQIMLDHAEQRFQDAITVWMAIPDDTLRLEAGMTAVATYIGGPDEGAQLTPMLDDLAQVFREQEPPHDPLALAHFLFTTRGLAGAREEYYAPGNSSLVHVLDSRKGIPISLACIYVLVGRRMGLDVEGCAWPGHFLALAMTEDETFVVDGFRDGATTPIEIFLTMQGPSRTAAEPFLAEPASPDSILLRVLGNLAHAYGETGQFARQKSVVRLREYLATTMGDRF